VVLCSIKSYDFMFVSRVFCAIFALLVVLPLYILARAVDVDSRGMALGWKPYIVSCQLLNSSFAIETANAGRI
jgi:hypothetical protein